jgi:hypothetical protein
LSVVTLVGAKPCLRSDLRISLTADRPVSTTPYQDLEDLALVVNGTPQIHVLARDPHDHFVEMPSDRSVEDGTVAGRERSPVRI